MKQLLFIIIAFLFISNAYAEKITDGKKSYKILKKGKIIWEGGKKQYMVRSRQFLVLSNNSVYSFQIIIDSDVEPYTAAIACAKYEVIDGEFPK